jgi:hypothetical protein
MTLFLSLDCLSQGLALSRQFVDADLAISVIGYSDIGTVWSWPFSLVHLKGANTPASIRHFLEHQPDNFTENADPLCLLVLTFPTIRSDLEYDWGAATPQEVLQPQNRQLESHVHNSEWLAVLSLSVLNEDVPHY